MACTNNFWSSLGFCHQDAGSVSMVTCAGLEIAQVNAFFKKMIKMKSYRGKTVGKISLLFSLLHGDEYSQLSRSRSIKRNKNDFYYEAEDVLLPFQETLSIPNVTS